MDNQRRYRVLWGTRPRNSYVVVDFTTQEVLLVTTNKSEAEVLADYLNGTVA